MRSPAAAPGSHEVPRQPRAHVCLDAAARQDRHEDGLEVAVGPGDGHRDARHTRRRVRRRAVASAVLALLLPLRLARKRRLGGLPTAGRHVRLPEHLRRRCRWHVRVLGLGGRAVAPEDLCNLPDGVLEAVRVARPQRRGLQNGWRALLPWGLPRGAPPAGAPQVAAGGRIASAARLRALPLLVGPPALPLEPLLLLRSRLAALLLRRIPLCGQEPLLLQLERR
mmetsp:Transcript_10745/g.25499  ORF Transcript_10745/g.25499 Transcript_10745/m.25499 type:complete len:224 (-) Transcript_10745:589-1260(-)